MGDWGERAACALGPGGAAQAGSGDAYRPARDNQARLEEKQESQNRRQGTF